MNFMLNVVAAFLVVFGLIGIFSFFLKYLQSKGNLNKSWLSPNNPNLIVESSTPIDDKRKIVSVVYQDSRYVFMLGQNNDILLETSPIHKAIVTRERQHA